MKRGASQRFRESGRSNLQGAAVRWTVTAGAHKLRRSSASRPKLLDKNRIEPATGQVQGHKQFAA